MQYLGRYMLGDYVPVVVRTHAGDHIPAAPTAAPIAATYDTSSKVENLGKIALVDPSATTGLFLKRIKLDSTYSTGPHTVLVTYVISGSTYSQEFSFEIIAGGDADGNIIASEEFQRPEAVNLIHQRDGSGDVVSGRNPY